MHRYAYTTCYLEPTQEGNQRPRSEDSKPQAKTADTTETNHPRYALGQGVNRAMAGYLKVGLPTDSRRAERVWPKRNNEQKSLFTFVSGRFRMAFETWIAFDRTKEPGLRAELAPLFPLSKAIQRRRSCSWRIENPSLGIRAKNSPLAGLCSMAWEPEKGRRCLGPERVDPVAVCPFELSTLPERKWKMPRW